MAPDEIETSTSSRQDTGSGDQATGVNIIQEMVEVSEGQSQISSPEGEDASIAIEATVETVSSQERCDELRNVAMVEIEPVSTSRFPTMWLGAQNGYLHIHSAVSRRNECLHKGKYIFYKRFRNPM